MFADFEDEVFVNEQLLDESEEWLADVLTEEELSDLEEIDALVELFGRKKDTRTPEEKKFDKEFEKRAASTRRPHMARSYYRRAKELPGKAYGAVKAGAGKAHGATWGKMSKGQKVAAGVGAGLAAAGGAALLAKRMKKRKECRAKFPNDPAKYKACVKA